ncbi:SH3 domain-containing protein [Mycotypha africana]|uniref:SH3 domain-containing protein n=1 Tax=Mycotypha africana TaxID=64632 RepID=UPI002301FE08|nr:SH3 domain-containing protein [Mycotypha africana]KAI8970475.1 SH3 domain-containing protein [Mycotypha africana]
MSQIEILCRVQALYSFSSNDPSSLSFEQNDYIDVLNKLPSGWWDGLCNGARGWFPSNYVRVICDEKSCFQEQLVLVNSIQWIAITD